MLASLLFVPAIAQLDQAQEQPRNDQSAQHTTSAAVSPNAQAPKPEGLDGESTLFLGTEFIRIPLTVRALVMEQESFKDAYDSPEISSKHKTTIAFDAHARKLEEVSSYSFSAPWTFTDSDVTRYTYEGDSQRALSEVTTRSTKKDSHCERQVNREFDARGRPSMEQTLEKRGDTLEETERRVWRYDDDAGTSEQDTTYSTIGILQREYYRGGTYAGMAQFGKLGEIRVRSQKTYEPDGKWEEKTWDAEGKITELCKLLDRNDAGGEVWGWVDVEKGGITRKQVRSPTVPLNPKDGVGTEQLIVEYTCIDGANPVATKMWTTRWNAAGRPVRNQFFEPVFEPRADGGFSVRLERSSEHRYEYDAKGMLVSYVHEKCDYKASKKTQISERATIVPNYR